MLLKYYAIVFLCITLIFLPSCGQQVTRPDGPKQKQFDIKSLAKSDIDIVIDIHVNEMCSYLRKLMIKLYKRNPRELKKSRYQTIDENLVRVFDLEHEWDFEELNYLKGIDAIRLTFNETYNGDRVFAFIVGLTSMIMASYNYKTDFYLFDTVDPQKLYNSARNIEIAVWKLGHDTSPEGELYLYSNSLPGETVNLSYERLFGKIIAIQDMMAIIIANKTNRIIKKVIQNMATAVFLPI